MAMREVTYQALRNATSAESYQELIRRTTDRPDGAIVTEEESAILCDIVQCSRIQRPTGVLFETSADATDRTSSPTCSISTVFASDAWYLILAFVHVEPPAGSIIPSNHHIFDAARLARCSRTLAGAAGHQIERLAAIYSRYHAWVDSQPWMAKELFFDSEVADGFIGLNVLDRLEGDWENVIGAMREVIAAQVPLTAAVGQGCAVALQAARRAATTHPEADWPHDDYGLRGAPSTLGSGAPAVNLAVRHASVEEATSSSYSSGLD